MSKDFEKYLKRKNEDLIGVLGEETFMEEKVFTAKETCEMVSEWQDEFYAKRAFLADVFQDTTKQLKTTYGYANPGEKKFIEEMQNVPVIYDSEETTIKVIDGDCVTIAREFLINTEKKTCILNMASAKKPGGGVIGGARAQEEELCRRSNLFFTLNGIKYPLLYDEYVYSENVSFFKDEFYGKIDRFKCDVITIAAVNRNSKYWADDVTDDYEKIMRAKIRAILFEPNQHGCKILILSAFGCGVFKNDPAVIATMFKEELERFKHAYDNVIFAIYNDHNSDADNFKIFKDILDA